MRLSQLTENLSLKLFSLAVAILLFLFVSVESATPVDVDFRIEYRTTDDMMVLDEPPQVVHTTLQGPWASFRSFDINELKPVLVDLSGYGPGPTRYSLNTNDITPPGGMTVVAIRPSQLELTLDRKIERQVPVLVDTVGSPAFGYEVGEVTTQPPRVRVSGPAGALQALEYVYTRPVSLDGHNEDFTTEVELKPLPAPLNLKEKRVRATVQIQPEQATRSLNLPVTVEHAPPGTHVAPATVAITIKGPRQVIDGVTTGKAVAYVELTDDSEQAKGSFDAVVKVRGLPDRVQLSGQVPHVQVKLGKSKSTTRR